MIICNNRVMVKKYNSKNKEVMLVVLLIDKNKRAFLQLKITFLLDFNIHDHDDV